MYVLAHLSDVHLAPLPVPSPQELISKRGLGYLNWLRKRRRVHRAEMLAKVVADLKARTPDHIAVTGDLTNLSLAKEFVAARAWIEALGSPDKVTVVPGNHDCYVRSAETFAAEHWAEYMCGDDDGGFPFVRRRGPLAIIGLSTSLPTPPLAATGALHGGQLERLGDVLSALGREQAFRTVLIHHTPVDGAHHFRRMRDASAMREVLRRHGAELVLHGHHHTSSLAWLPGPQFRIPVAGVPSASVAPGRHHDDLAGYHLYEIDGAPGAWRGTLLVRGWDANDRRIVEIRRQPLIG
ncbi:MAG: metallophosphoesterase [Xanthobacteraceae bacterium]|nr:metallophosphoesterase [Xanthobacteraceae bacterium]